MTETCQFTNCNEEARFAPKIWVPMEFASKYQRRNAHIVVHLKCCKAHALAFDYKALLLDPPIVEVILATCARDGALGARIDLAYVEALSLTSQEWKQTDAQHRAANRGEEDAEPQTAEAAASAETARTASEASGRPTEEADVETWPPGRVAPTHH
jgi:hypothetical protein